MLHGVLVTPEQKEYVVARIMSRIEPLPEPEREALHSHYLQEIEAFENAGLKIVTVETIDQMIDMAQYMRGDGSSQQKK